jgi:hypothetical protein
MIIMNNQYINSLGHRIEALMQRLGEVASQSDSQVAASVLSEPKRYITSSAHKNEFSNHHPSKAGILRQPPQTKGDELRTATSERGGSPVLQVLDIINNSLTG